MGKPPKIRQPTKAQMEERWKSTNPRDLAYEIATFMGGEWPERPVRKVQIDLTGAPTECEDLMVMTQLNPTLLSEMTVTTRELFLEVYFDDVQDVYSQVMETLDGSSRWAARCPRSSSVAPLPISALPLPARCRLHSRRCSRVAALAQRHLRYAAQVQAPEHLARLQGGLGRVSGSIRPPGD